MFLSKQPNGLPYIAFSIACLPSLLWFLPQQRMQRKRDTSWHPTKPNLCLPLPDTSFRPKQPFPFLPTYEILISEGLSFLP